jgi:serine/threonine protein kinase
MKITTKEKNDLYNVVNDDGTPIPSLFGKFHTDMKRYKEEIIRLDMIKNINGVVRIVSTQNNIIYLEKIDGDDLYNILDKIGNFSEKSACNITKQLLKIVQDLHDIDVIHGDIKPENIMYNKKTEKITLVDFEWGRYSRNYAAPELIMKKRRTKAIDIWGIGVTIYTLLMGHNPYNNCRHIVSGFPPFELNYSLSSQCKKFITDTLTFDIRFRPSIDQCLLYDWVHDTEKSNSLIFQFEIIDEDNQCYSICPKCCTIS